MTGSFRQWINSKQLNRKQIEGLNFICSLDCCWNKNQHCGWSNLLLHLFQHSFYFQGEHQTLFDAFHFHIPQFRQHNLSVFDVEWSRVKFVYEPDTVSECCLMMSCNNSYINQSVHITAFHTLYNHMLYGKCAVVAVGGCYNSSRFT